MLTLPCLLGCLQISNKSVMMQEVDALACNSILLPELITPSLLSKAVRTNSENRHRVAVRIHCMYTEGSF